MKQRTFEKLHKDLWERCLDLADGDGIADPLDLPSLHRRLCQSLSLSRSRGYSPSLTARLEHLAQSTYAKLYGAPGDAPARLREWMLGGFPRQVRREWATVLLALAAFWGPALAVGILLHLRPTWMESFLSPDQVERMRSMYSPESVRLGRQGDQNDFLMFGFYIWNNVSILFRTFAAGVFLGVPSLLSLALNGVDGGAVAALLSDDPRTRLPFWSFVATHSSLEITGLALGGSGGLRLGWSLVASGRRGRLENFRQAAQATLPILAGSTAMLVGAALVESFWSANPAIPPQVRLASGACAWAAIASYFLLAGRRHAA